VSNLVAFLGMIPEPAHIVDAGAVVVNKSIIDRDGAVVAVTGVAVPLQLLQASLVECLHIPGVMVDEAVETGLVGGTGELGIDAADGLAGSDVQAGEVLGEMASLRLVSEQIAKVAEGLLNHLGELNDASHGHALVRRKTRQIVYKHLHRRPESLNFAKPQFKQRALMKLWDLLQSAVEYPDLESILFDTDAESEIEINEIEISEDGGAWVNLEFHGTVGVPLQTLFASAGEDDSAAQALVEKLRTPSTRRKSSPEGEGCPTAQ
jgi:hypothetical protein